MSTFERTNIQQFLSYLQKSERTLEKLDNSINALTVAASKIDPPNEGGGIDPSNSEDAKRQARLNHNKGRREEIIEEKKERWQSIGQDILASIGISVVENKLGQKGSKLGSAYSIYSIASGLWAISEMAQEERSLNSQINKDQEDPETQRIIHNVRRNDKSKGASYPRKNTYLGSFGMPGGVNGEGESKNDLESEYAASDNELRKAKKIISPDKTKATKGKGGPEPHEVFEMAFGEARKLGSSLNTIMNNLKIGAHTFVGEVINGFGTALSVIEAITPDEDYGDNFLNQGYNTTKTALEGDINIAIF